MIKVDVTTIREEDRDTLPIAGHRLLWKILHHSPTGEVSCMASGVASTPEQAEMDVSNRMSNLLDESLTLSRETLRTAMQSVLNQVRERRNVLEGEIDDHPHSVTAAARLEEITGVLELLRHGLRKGFRTT